MHGSTGCTKCTESMVWSGRKHSFRKSLIGNSWHVGVTEFWLMAFLTSDAAPTASIGHMLGQKVPEKCPSRGQYDRAMFPKHGLYIGEGVLRIGLKSSKWSNPYPLRLCSSRGRLFGQVPCLRTRPAVIDECFTRAGRKGVTLPLPCW